MLESITIRNFQKHVKRTIHFDPRVTTIIGATDSGKSAILRALRWICLNQFPGPADSFIHWDAAFTKAILRIDGHVLTRKKGTTNAFSLDEQEYRAFGVGKVPEPIADFLQLNAVNFQSQFDGHFWLSDSAGQISRELNQIINLEVIDESLASVASTLRSTNAEAELFRKHTATSRGRLKELAWTLPADEQLKELEATESSLSQRASRIRVLTGLMARAKDLTGTIKGTTEIVSFAARLSALFDHAVATKNRTKMLRDLIADMKRTHQASLIQVPAIAVSPNKAQQIAKRVNVLERLIQQLERTEKASCENQTTANQIKTELAKEMEKRCPLCGSTKSSPSCAQTST